MREMAKQKLKVVEIKLASLEIRVGYKWVVEFQAWPSLEMVILAMEIALGLGFLVGASSL